jgi:nucleoside-diphosphate-sugar epimerase
MGLRVLIIGCGYVGLPLGTALVRAGHSVYGLRRRPSTARALEAAGLIALTGDITRPEELRQLPGPFDWVINTVASPPGSAIDDYRRTYLEGTRHLLEWLKSQPPKCYLYTGSTGVYGQQDGGWVDEFSIVEPAAPTAKVLEQSERTLLDAHGDHGFPAVILRLAGIYGPGRSYWLRQFLSGTVRIPGDGQRWMNMVHREDVVASIQAGLTRGRAGEIYNVCDDEPVSYLELFRWLARRTGRPRPVFAPPDPAGPSSKRGVTNKRVSNRKLRETLGVNLSYPSYREGYAALLRSEPPGEPS